MSTIGALSKLFGRFRRSSAGPAAIRERLQAIAADPENTELQIGFAAWLKERGDVWGEFIELEFELAELSDSDPWRWRRIDRRNELHAEVTKRLFRPLKRLGVKPTYDDDDKPDAWMHRGLLRKVIIDRDGILPERVDKLFRAAPGLQRIEFHGSRYQPRLRSAETLEFHPDFSRLLTLPQMKQITGLQFKDINLVERDILAIADSPARFVELNIDRIHYDANPDILMPLADAKSMERLRVLNLRDVCLDDSTLIAFLQSEIFSCLEEFHVDGTCLSLDGMRAFASSSKLSELKVLKANGWQLGVEGAAALADSPTISKLTELHLDGTGDGTEGIAALASSTDLAHLVELSFADNQIGTNGAVCIAESLFLNQLQTLDLRSNNIDRDGARALAESPNMKSVRVLHLSHNPIGEKGAEALARSTMFRSLQELSLDGCDINPQAVNYLLDADWMPQLRKLSFTGREIGEAGARALLAADNLANLDLLSVGFLDIDNDLSDELIDRFEDSMSYYVA